MKAVIMAGGEGTRLRPLTSNQPKPMVTIVNKTTLEHIIELVKKHGITDIVVTLQFLPQQIKHYFGEGFDMGVNLKYSIEESPLGTAGSVKNAEGYLDETFIVISGDALTDIDLSQVIDFHRRKKALVTVALKQVENPLEYGVVITDDNKKIVRFLEKPTWGDVFSDTINTGIYVLEPKIFEYIPKDKPFDFSQDLFPLLLKKGLPLYGCVVKGYWCDIGGLEQYMLAQHDFLKGKVKLDPPGIKMLKDIWVGEGAYIHPLAKLTGPLIIGDYARIEADAKVGKYSVIGNNVRVATKARVDRAVVGENSYIGPNANLNYCVVGKNCDVKAGARLAERVVVGDECVIGINAVINHDVKIYPFKTIDAGAIINKSIIWETRGMHTLFGKSGISGLINIDMTPALAIRVAAAYGTFLPKGAQVVTSRDSSQVSRMIKRAVLAGLNSTGVHCRDLRVAPATVNRFNVHTTGCLGGIHVRICPFDAQSVEINFFDSSGVNIGEDIQRKIERYYYREDFRRASYDEVGNTVFPSRTSEFYAEGLLKTLAKEAIRKRKFKIVVDYVFGSAPLILPHVIGKLGLEVISLNAFADEDRATISRRELSQFMKQLSQTVKIFKADLGVLIDSNCEKAYFVDERGELITPNLALLLMTELVAQFEKKKGGIAVPMAAPLVVEEIAKKHGRKVKRTKVSARSLMEAASQKDIVFAGAQGGGYIFPQFLPAYDGIMSFCKLLEYLAKAKKPLSQIVASLPRTHLAHKNAFCPWDYKGLVMRRLMERTRDKKVELIDGIKIFDTNRWALILPDPEEPVFRIYAEADSESRAQAEVNNYIKFIKEIVSI